MTYSWLYERLFYDRQTINATRQYGEEWGDVAEPYVQLFIVRIE